MLPECSPRGLARGQRSTRAPAKGPPGSQPPTPHHPHLLLCAEGLRLQLLILALGNPQELFKVSLKKNPASLSGHSPAGVPPCQTQPQRVLTGRPPRGEGARTPDLNARPSAQTPSHGESPVATKTYRKRLLEQWSPSVLALGTSFVEDKLFHRLGGDGFRLIQAHFIYQAHFISTTITSAPPQIIRHQIPEVGDHCPRSSWSEREGDSHRCPRGSPQTGRRGSPCPENAKRKTRPPTLGLHRPQTGKPRPLDRTQTGP